MKVKFYSVYIKENFNDIITKDNFWKAIKIPKKFQGKSKKAFHFRYKIIDQLHFSCGFDFNVIVPENYKYHFLSKNYDMMFFDRKSILKRF